MGGCAVSKRAKDILDVLFLICLVIGISLLTQRIGINGGVYSLFGLPVEATHICSILSVVRLLLMVLFVMMKRKIAIIVVEILQFIEIILALVHLGFRYESTVFAAEGINILGVFIFLITYFYVDKQKKMSETDELTGLANKRALRLYAERLISSKDPFAISIINIDDFKYINDSFGYEYGDRLLIGLVDYWNNGGEVRNGKMPGKLARVGGDEFAYILPCDEGVDVAYKQLVSYMQGVPEGVCFAIDGKESYLSASIGVSFFPEDGEDFEKVFSNADMALHSAKLSGKQHIKRYEKSMSDDVKKRVSLEMEVRNALSQNGLFLNFQPQFHSKDKTLRGVETLVRLRDARGNIISPGVFIPIAEYTGLIEGVDSWVIENAMKQFKEMAMKRSDFTLSVNASVRSLFNYHFVSDLKNMLETTGFPPGSLEIEVTESLFIQSVQRAKVVLNEIKALGIKVALDDFGTGYSSLSYLRELPFDVLKVDKSFVDCMDDGENNPDNNLVEGIISMGHVMGMEIVAEGVENEKQLEKLKEQNCDFIQGYLWSKPLTLEMFQARFKRHFTDKVEGKQGAK